MERVLGAVCTAAPTTDDGRLHGSFAGPNPAMHRRLRAVVQPATLPPSSHWPIVQHLVSSSSTTNAMPTNHVPKGLESALQRILGNNAVLPTAATATNRVIRIHGVR